MVSGTIAGVTFAVLAFAFVGWVLFAAREILQELERDSPPVWPKADFWGNHRFGVEPYLEHYDPYEEEFVAYTLRVYDRDFLIPFPTKIGFVVDLMRELKRSGCTFEETNEITQEAMRQAIEVHQRYNEKKGEDPAESRASLCGDPPPSGGWETA